MPPVRSLLAPAMVALLLAGCNATPTDYRSQREIPEGPGMLSGEEGRFVLFEGRRAGGGGEAAPGPADEQAFREFQRFQEYQAWKEQARESGEYQEFREWLRWREYQRWKEEGAGEGADR